MWLYTLGIDGMECGMCETHVNDVVRQNFRIKKVTSSHTKNETVILAPDELDEEKLKDAIEKTGYRVVSVAKAPYEKKGLFGRHK